jgi:20S proteasome alpha/beta subunit
MWLTLGQLILLLILPSTTNLLLGIIAVVDAAQSSSRRGNGRPSSSSYDRLISTFSPDGRLEQVEYAALAATRTIMAAVVERQQIIIVAPTGSLLQPIYIDYSDDDDEADETTPLSQHDNVVVDRKEGEAIQEDPSGISASSTSTTNNNSSTMTNQKRAASSRIVWMIGTGIAGDVLYLRDFLRAQALDHAMVWQDVDPTDTRHMVQMLARDAEIQCHRRTFVAGARPLAVAALLLAGGGGGAMVDDDEDAVVPQLALVSGWNGAVTGLDFACLGPHQDAVRAFVQRRCQTATTVPSSRPAVVHVVETLVDAAQQVLGSKTDLDVWIVSSAHGTIRQYTNVRDRASRRRLLDDLPGQPRNGGA